LQKKIQNNIKNKIGLSLIFLIQLAFCVLVIWYKPQFWYFAFILIFSWLLLPPVLHNQQKWWLLMVFSFLGLYCTLFLKIYLNTILAASIASFLIQFVPKISNYAKAIFYAGAFAAMGDFVFLNEFSTVVIPFVCATFAWFTQNLHNGIGGKLGTIGFFGAAIHFLIELIIK
jgi:hypothetical protein